MALLLMWATVGFAFTPLHAIPGRTSTSSSSPSRSATLVRYSSAGRRAFVEQLLVAVPTLVITPGLVLAEEGGELGDLEAPEVSAAPSVDEQARIAAKLAAQKASGSAINRKLTAAEALKAEQEKKAAIKSKSKKESREDLCEMLGRGC